MEIINAVNNIAGGIENSYRRNKIEKHEMASYQKIKDHKSEMKKLCDTDQFSPKDVEFETALRHVRSLPNITVEPDITELNSDFTQRIQKYTNKIESQESTLTSTFQQMEKFNLNIEEEKLKVSEKEAELRKLILKNKMENLPWSEEAKQKTEEIKKMKKEIKQQRKSISRKYVTELDPLQDTYDEAKSKVENSQKQIKKIEEQRKKELIDKVMPQIRIALQYYSIYQLTATKQVDPEFTKKLPKGQAEANKLINSFQSQNLKSAITISLAEPLESIDKQHDTTENQLITQLLNIYDHAIKDETSPYNQEFKDFCKKNNDKLDEQIKNEKERKERDAKEDKAIDDDEDGR